MLAARLLVVALLTLQNVQRAHSTTLAAKVWTFDPEAFPEMGATGDALSGFKSRPNSGMANAGNAAAAYLMTQGALRGLSQLRLIQNIRCARRPSVLQCLTGFRYMSCNSGGNLATTVFTYYARGADGVASSDRVPPLQPVSYCSFQCGAGVAWALHPSGKPHLGTS